jgi:hypothetical protein
MSLRLCCREAPHDCACTLLEGFHVLEHLPRERNASLNTIETYADRTSLEVRFLRWVPDTLTPSWSSTTP